jgi:hypothetical protein
LLLTVILCRPYYTETDDRKICEKNEGTTWEGKRSWPISRQYPGKTEEEDEKLVLVQPVSGPKYELQTSRAQSSSAAHLSQLKPAYNVTSEFGMWSEEIAIQMSKLSHFELLNVGETRYWSYYGLKAS